MGFRWRLCPCRCGLGSFRFLPEQVRCRITRHLDLRPDLRLGGKILAGLILYLTPNFLQGNLLVQRFSNNAQPGVPVVPYPQLLLSGFILLLPLTGALLKRVAVTSKLLQTLLRFSKLLGCIPELNATFLGVSIRFHQRALTLTDPLQEKSVLVITHFSSLPPNSSSRAAIT